MLRSPVNAEVEGLESKGVESSGGLGAVDDPTPGEEPKEGPPTSVVAEAFAVSTVIPEYRVVMRAHRMIGPRMGYIGSRCM